MCRNFHIFAGAICVFTTPTRVQYYYIINLKKQQSKKKTTPSILLLYFIMTSTTTIPLEGILTFLDTMTLSIQNKKWLGEQLIEQAVREERLAKKGLSSKRTIRVKRRSACSPSDEELSARFVGKDVPRVPNDPDWNQVIDANTGKTIKPIEKWL